MKNDKSLLSETGPLARRYMKKRNRKLLRSAAKALIRQELNQ